MLTPVLEDHVGAEKLVLPYANLGTQDICQVSDFLASSESKGKLRYLDLRGNSIDGLGAASLARAVPSCQTLETLVLACSDLGVCAPEGLQALCSALGECKALTHLDLSWNGLAASPSTSWIRTLVQGNARIKSIDLTGNPLGKEGGQIILDGLCMNTNLVECTLASAGLPDWMLSKISDMLGRNKTTARRPPVVVHEQPPAPRQPNLTAAYGQLLLDHKLHSIQTRLESEDRAAGLSEARIHLLGDSFRSREQRHLKAKASLEAEITNACADVSALQQSVEEKMRDLEVCRNACAQLAELLSREEYESRGEQRREQAHLQQICKEKAGMLLTYFELEQAITKQDAEKERLMKRAAELRTKMVALQPHGV